MKSTFTRLPGPVASLNNGFAFGVQWIFAILAPSGTGLPFCRNAGAVSGDHRGIAKNDRDHSFVPADGNGLPIFVSPELRHRQPARYLCAVLVLCGNGKAGHQGQYYGEDYSHLDIHTNPIVIAASRFIAVLL